MLCIQNDSTNPYFNLATEEYLLRNFTEDCFMLYQNESSIIVGKHQNTLAEINYDYVKKNKIDVVRRLSGGGTVFHDLGNLNFMFIQNAERENNLVDFKKYTKPIIEVLHQLCVNAKFEGRNDIMINGKKISGNAEHVFKKRVLHHGTLLFSSQIKKLSQALKVNPLKYNDKGVKSVRSRVTNIQDYLLEKIDVGDFKDKIEKHIHNVYSNVKDYKLDNFDIAQINKLVDIKYSTWKWNFAYSPKYTFEKTIQLENGSLEILLFVEKGIIAKIELVGSGLDENIKTKLKKVLLGKEHEEIIIRKTLLQKFPNNLIQNFRVNDFLFSLF